MINELDATAILAGLMLMCGLSAAVGIGLWKLLANGPGHDANRNPNPPPKGSPPISKMLPDRPPLPPPPPVRVEIVNDDRRLNGLCEMVDAAERRLQALEQRVDDLMFGGERGAR